MLCPRVSPEARYRIETLIGRGGMAEVHRARDGERNVAVAIKRMLPSVAEDGALATLFEDEATIAGRLRHPNLVAVLDAGTLGGRPFQALELVDGCDAGALLERTVMPAPLALWVAEQIATGLAHAHAATGPDGEPLGIVHRDVSPSNVLLGRDGTVKLGDFGIAVGKDRRERTRTGLTKGKAAYMAPEQTLGSAVDARTDVFGLGCTLAALMTGKSPLADPDAVAGLLAGEAVPLSHAMDGHAAAIVARAISPRPSTRFPSMEAMASACGAAATQMGATREALAIWMSDHAPARAAGSPATIEVPPQRRRPWAGVAAAMLALLAVGIAWRAYEAPPGLVASDPPAPETPPIAPYIEPPIDLPRVAPEAELVMPEPERTTSEPTTSEPMTSERATRVATTARAVIPHEAPAAPTTERAAPSSPGWGVVNFRLPRDARVTLDGGATPFRDVQRGHACDTTGLCHLAAGRHTVSVTAPDGERATATLCVVEEATVRASWPLPSEIGCN